MPVGAKYVGVSLLGCVAATTWSMSAPGRNSDTWMAATVAAMMMLVCSVVVPRYQQLTREGKWNVRKPTPKVAPRACKAFFAVPLQAMCTLAVTVYGSLFDQEFMRNLAASPRRILLEIARIAEGVGDFVRSFIEVCWCSFVVLPRIRVLWCGRWRRSSFTWALGPHPPTLFRPPDGKEGHHQTCPSACRAAPFAPGEPGRPGPRRVHCAALLCACSHTGCVCGVQRPGHRRSGGPRAPCVRSRESGALVCGCCEGQVGHSLCTGLHRPRPCRQCDRNRGNEHGWGYRTHIGRCVDCWRLLLIFLCAVRLGTVPPCASSTSIECILSSFTHQGRWTVTTWLSPGDSMGRQTTYLPMWHSHALCDTYGRFTGSCAGVACV